MFFFIKTHSILELTSTSSHNANGKSVPISLKIKADDGQLPNKKGGNDKRGPTLWSTSMVSGIWIKSVSQAIFFFFALCMLLLFAILVSPKAVGTNTPLLFSYGNIGCNNLVQFRVTDPFAAPTWLLLLLLRTLPTPSLHPLGASAGEEAARIDRRRRTKNHLPYFDTQTRVTPKFGIPEWKRKAIRVVEFDSFSLNKKCVFIVILSSS